MKVELHPSDLRKIDTAEHGGILPGEGQIRDEQGKSRKPPLNIHRLPEIFTYCHISPTPSRPGAGGAPASSWR